MENLLPYLWFLPVGFIAGSLGTFVGAGGGFLVVPFLALWDPTLGPETITAISLGVIFFNSASGSLRYAKTKRIDYKSGLTFAVATMPGAALGALTSNYLPRQTFNMMFGIFMMCVAVFLLLKPHKAESVQTVPRPGHFKRSVTDASGKTHVYSYNRGLGIGLSAIVGYLSSLLGIGGGIIHVPLMTRLMNFPVHLATATSHFILTITALTGATVHLIGGDYSNSTTLTMLAALTIGVIPGAQFGARLSERAKPAWILRGLSVVLAIVAVRLLVGLGKN
jgi:uncharacterized membrane protein YfcA